MKRITLTFDNGPSTGTTPFVLDELAARGIQAYFCLIGRQLQASNEHVDVARATLARGHVLVNHSMTHGTALGDDPTAHHAEQEIVQMHELMEATLGDWGQRWFRPFGRGGQLGPHIFSRPALEQLESLQYSVVLWNSVPRDWEDTDGWVEKALAEIDRTEHTVLVVHDIGTGAMVHLPRFLDELSRLKIETTLELPDSCVPLRAGRKNMSPAEIQGLTR